MRPQGRGELESLYFDYPHFDPPDAAQLAADGQQHAIIIIGAGPVGLATALSLASHGVRSVIIDNKATYNDGSRAICLARSSLYAFERMGVEQRFVATALGWTTGCNYYRGTNIGRFSLPHSSDDKYYPMSNLQQQYIEQFLHEAALQSGMVDVRWQSSIVSIEQNGNGVRVGVQTPDTHYQLQAQYCLAADGGRSPTRNLLGLKLQGDNLQGRYVIADVLADLDLPVERHALFEPRSNPGGSVLLHVQPGNLWRVDYQLKADEDPDAAVEEANIRARVGAILDEVGYTGEWQLEWWSIYVANTLCLDDYRHQRVFFVGDSAHIVPIFGVRGLNNGILDAENIGWKLARVLRGDSPASLLDSYSPERRGATLDVFANTIKSAAFVTPPTDGHRLLRKAALSLALSDKTFTALSNSRNMTPYRHAEGMLTHVTESDAAFSAGPAAGSFSLNARLGDGSFLLDYMGPGYTVIGFSLSQSDAACIAERGVARDPQFRLILVTPDTADRAGGVADHGFGGESCIIYIEDTSGHIADRFGANGVNSSEAIGITANRLAVKPAVAAGVITEINTDDTKVDVTPVSSSRLSPGNASASPSEDTATYLTDSSCYLLRPDQYVVARWRNPTADEVVQWML